MRHETPKDAQRSKRTLVTIGDFLKNSKAELIEGFLERIESDPRYTMWSDLISIQYFEAEKFKVGMVLTDQVKYWKREGHFLLGKMRKLAQGYEKLLNTKPTHQYLEILTAKKDSLILCSEIYLDGLGLYIRSSNYRFFSIEKIMQNLPASFRSGKTYLAGVLECNSQVGYVDQVGYKKCHFRSQGRIFFDIAKEQKRTLKKIDKAKNTLSNEILRPDEILELEKRKFCDTKLKNEKASEKAWAEFEIKMPGWEARIARMPEELAAREAARVQRQAEWEAGRAQREAEYEAELEAGRAQREAARAQMEAETAQRQAQRQAEWEAGRAQREAARAQMEAQREVELEARVEAARAARAQMEAQREVEKEAKKEAKKAELEAKKAQRQAEWEAGRAQREAEYEAEMKARHKERKAEWEARRRKMFNRSPHYQNKDLQPTEIESRLNNEGKIGERIYENQGEQAAATLESNENLSPNSLLNNIQGGNMQTTEIELNNINDHTGHAQERNVKYKTVHDQEIEHELVIKKYNSSALFNIGIPIVITAVSSTAMGYGTFCLSKELRCTLNPDYPHILLSIGAAILGAIILGALFKGYYDNHHQNTESISPV
jgi:hypothetical protein